MTDDADRSNRHRRVVMSDDDRALIGGRARSISGEINTPDSFDEITPVESPRAERLYDRSSVSGRLEALHDKMGQVVDRANVLTRQFTALKSTHEEWRKAVDEDRAETKQERKSGAAQRWAIAAGIAGALGTGGVAIYTSAVEKGELGATIRQLVDTVREHDRRLDRIEWWSRRTSPIDSARTGD